MRFSTFLLGLIPLALATPIELEKRADNSKAVLADLKKTVSETTSLNKTLNTFADNAATIPSNTEVTLSNENTAIENALKAAIKSAKASSKFTAAESKSITSAVTAAENPTFQTLDNLAAHKVAFDNAGITSLVVSNLNTQKGLIDQLGAALKAKATATYASQEPAIVAKFDAAFQSAISTLNG